MIEGYDKHGKLRYRFISALSMGNYFQVSPTSIGASLQKNRQWDYNNCIFHEADAEKITIGDFCRMFDAVIEDNKFDPLKTGYAVETQYGLKSIIYEDKVIGMNLKFSEIDTKSMYHGIMQAMAKSVRDPEFAEDFGYPQPKVNYVHSEDESDSIEGAYLVDVEKMEVVDPNQTRINFEGDINETIEYYKARNKKMVEMVEGGVDHDIDKMRACAIEEWKKQAADIQQEFEHRLMFGNMPVQSKLDIKNHMDAEDGGKYDEKGNSAHYQAHFMEFVRKQERAYGTIVAYLLCNDMVDKYSQRVGMKDGVPPEKDLTKRDWYFKAAQHFKKKIEAQKNHDDIDNSRLTGRNSYVPLAEEVLDLLRAEHSVKVNGSEYTPLSKCIEK